MDWRLATSPACGGETIHADRSRASAPLPSCRAHAGAAVWWPCAAGEGCVGWASCWCERQRRFPSRRPLGLFPLAAVLVFVIYGIAGSPNSLLWHSRKV